MRYKGIVITALLLLSICETYAQIIDGPTSVNAEQTYYYSVSGSIPSNAVWNAYYGTVVSSSSMGATITWRCGMAQGTVYITSNGSTVTMKNVTITQSPIFNSGSISAATPYVNYNGYTTLSGSAASGGTCNSGDYYYQWQSSSNGQPFTDISGATGTSYGTGLLAAPVTYRRGARRGTSSSFQYSNEVQVNVYDPVIAGTISLSQNINYNAAADMLSSNPGSGGNNTYSYQWLSSSTGAPGSFSVIPGATGLTYYPGALTATKYFQVEVNSNGATAVSNIIAVNVYPQLVAGTLTPSATVNYNGSTSFTATASGGTGSYSYQWWSSTDNSTFTPVNAQQGGQNATYTTGSLQQTMYYKAEVISNGASAFSNIATVTVLVPMGVAAPSNITGDANGNMNWVKATVYNPSGNVIGAGKEFFDYSGQLLQSQNKVFYRLNDNTVYTHVFASQPMKDQLGRTAGTTLAAPIDYAEFNYKSDFIQASDGTAYGYKNFELGPVTRKAGFTLDQPNTSGTHQAAQFIILDEGFTTDPNADFVAEIVTGGSIIDKTNSPDPVGNQNIKGTLGWYYSSNNTWEPYTPETDYPFSRTVFYNDGSGMAKKSTGAGDVFKMGNGHEVRSFVTPVINELQDYIRIRNAFFNSPNLGTFPASLKNQAVQSISHDENGKEGVVIQDKQGKTLFTGRPGTDLAVSNSVTVDAGGIHYFKLFASGVVTVSGGSFSIIDMESEQPVSFTSGSNLQTGYYKLVNTGSTTITLDYSNNYTDVSYSYYNQLGQLIATIAPEGVKKLAGTGINTYVNSSYPIPYTTTYEYDTKGRLVKKTSPDAGTTEFVYRNDGKLRFSKNSVQTNNKYSYINYDQYGRPIEYGIYDGNLTFNSDPSVNSPMKQILENTTPTGGLETGGAGTKSEVITRFYDLVNNTHGLGYTQNEINMGGKVSMAVRYSHNAIPATESADPSTGFYPAAYVNSYITSRTWYNYDEEGKVTWMIQQIAGLGYKTTDYTYDVAGRLTKKLYQKGQADEFVHYYDYDPQTQNLAKVSTNTVDNYVTKVLRATYIYYLHGPLKRIELGGKLQGIDYTYNLQGSLKAINNSRKGVDPGFDGTNGIPEDAFGMVLDYYTGDYINNKNVLKIRGVNTPGIADSYAGNIKAVTWFSKKAPLPGSEDPITNVYKYDDKYQFSESIWGTNVTTTTPADFTTTGINKEAVKNPNGTPGYDANGNIRALQRTNAAGAVVDDFTYGYDGAYVGGDPGFYNTNKLQYILSGGNYIRSFEYDNMGRLIYDWDYQTNKNKLVDYNNGSKVTSVKDPNSGLLRVSFEYDENGQRIKKLNYNASGQLILVTYYVENVIYTQPVSGGVYGAVTAQEYEIQGASTRLGTYYRPTNIYAYELTDHLGNVRAVIAQSGSSYDVRMYSDYYPFGMALQGNSSSYRYGYQGQHSEKDDETDWNAFELRMYDSKIARWLSVDPEGEFWSPYVGMGNEPVSKTDPTGGSTSPIYGLDGNFLGTDDEGLQGEGIIMDRKNFQQGMSHSDALKWNLGVKALATPQAKARYANHYYELSSRPDWDGFVTISEGVDWALAHPGALANPTPDNSLYINTAKLNFGDTRIFDFKSRLNTATPLNLNTFGNFLDSKFNTTLRGTVYALGRVNLVLLDYTGRVKIVNDDATDYDWNDGGSWVRNKLIHYEWWRTGLNGTHGFKAYYYGVGQLRSFGPSGHLELPQPGTAAFEMVR
jgi:RHS repeat-associated protein